MVQVPVGAVRLGQEVRLVEKQEKHPDERDVRSSEQQWVQCVARLLEGREIDAHEELCAS